MTMLMPCGRADKAAAAARGSVPCIAKKMWPLTYIEAAPGISWVFNSSGEKPHVAPSSRCISMNWMEVPSSCPRRPSSRPSRRCEDDADRRRLPLKSYAARSRLVPGDPGVGSER